RGANHDRVKRRRRADANGATTGSGRICDGTVVSRGADLATRGVQHQRRCEITVVPHLIIPHSPIIAPASCDRSRASSPSLSAVVHSPAESSGFSASAALFAAGTDGFDGRRKRSRTLA